MLFNMFFFSGYEFTWRRTGRQWQYTYFSSERGSSQWYEVCFSLFIFSSFKFEN